MLLRSVLLLMLLAIPLSGASAERRVALVVGNAGYQNITPLANAQNDATLIAETLRGVGFTLVGGGAQVNLDKPAFDKAVQSFGNQLIGADVALFYYAGHGVQIRGSNYLVPVSANPVREADVDFQMVDVALILRQMEGSGTKLNLVILDACRNNPFGGRGLRSAESGLAQIRAPEGTLLSYATQPGNVALDGTGNHSPYSQALSETIRKPGLDVFQTFNQVGLLVKRATGGAQQPWVSSSPIDGSFYFASPREEPKETSKEAGKEARRDEPGIAERQPSPPPPPQASAPRVTANPPTLQQRALAFVTNDMIRSEGSAAEYLDYARQSIDDQVDYYGKLTSRAEVLKDKERYVARWPVRSYRLRTESIRTSCDESKATCRIDGLLDFDLSNPADGRKSSGASSFEFGIRFGADGGRIFFESGKIVAAQKKK
ncbi:caspase family protein [Bradyrhizobium sp.]|uniref:caspase family protein n=1 Tax=Bradyrhizobium sp. TaxID=376 RepID=UPI001D973511|nr:caspase family protein [Bradyrhizobium sp.]MBI5318466.1 caspase family protein [Bradyrhizobium sp.]